MINEPVVSPTGPGGCWPDPAQTFLLRAALLDPAAAREAWAGWKRAACLDTIDQGSYRLLPLVFRKLTQAAVDDPDLGRLKGVYRKTWYRNQLMLRDLAQVLRALRTAGIRLLVLKGMALSHVYYRDLGVRAMEDADVLVPVAQARTAAAVLQDLGWRPQYPWSEKRLATQHAVGFCNAAGRVIDLHWHLVPESCGEDADETFWAASRPTAVAGCDVLTLDPADELFHACAHGVRWNFVPPLRWIADAYTIVRTASVGMAWERLLAATERLRLALPIRDALHYLHTSLDVPVPPEILARLDQLPVSLGARCEHRVRVSALPASVLGNVPQYWFDALRRHGDEGMAETCRGFVRRIEVQWNCDGGRQLAVQALSRGLRRVRGWASRTA